MSTTQADIKIAARIVNAQIFDLTSIPEMHYKQRRWFHFLLEVA